MSTAPENRPLPSALDLERCVLSCMMQAPDFANAATLALRAEDFSVEAHALLFDTISGQFESGLPVEPAALAQVLYDRGHMDKAGGPANVSEIYCASPNPAHARHYADVVREKARQRDVVRAAWQLSNDIMLEPEKWRDASAAAVEAVIAATTGTGSRATIVHLRAAAVEACDAFEKAYINKGHVPEGYSTGFTHLDRLFWGLKPGDNVIWCGRPSMGKTAAAVCALANMAFGRGHYQEFYHNKADFETQTNPRQGKIKCVLVCLESPQVKMATRVLSGLSGVTMQRMRDGLVDRFTFQSLTRAASVVDQGEFYIWDAPGITVEDMEMELKAFKARHPDLAVVCVDHIGLLRARGVSDKASDYQRTGYISNRLMLLWRQLHVAGFPICQLSRKTEDRAKNDRRPKTSDLRDSGNLEQDATHIVGIYRPAYYAAENKKHSSKDDEDDDEGMDETEAYFCVLKNRDGAINPEGVRVNWDGQLTLFTSTSDKLFSNNDEKRQGGEFSAED